jgi:hypothetical protein
MMTIKTSTNIPYLLREIHLFSRLYECMQRLPAPHPLALAVSAGCAHRLFPTVLMDFVSEVRNLIGDISSRFVPARRCYQHTNSYADPHSDGQRDGFAEYVRFFFPAKSFGGTTDAVGRGTICVPDLALDAIHVVWQAISQGVNQVETGFEQDAKEWFSLSESQWCLLDDILSMSRCNICVRCWLRLPRL